MGFFDFMGRLASGQPAFQDNEAQKRPEAPGAAPQEATGPTVQKGVESTFPVVYIKNVKPNVNDNRTQVYCWIVNTWPEEVELDKIRIFNTKRELDTTLPGGGEREFLVYDGPTLTHEDHEVELDYKTRKDGDYFRAVHNATFSYRPEDKTYVVSDIHLEEPIRDIYG